MLILIMVCMLIPKALAVRVTESLEDIPDPHTKLFPLATPLPANQTSGEKAPGDPITDQNTQGNDVTEAKANDTSFKSSVWKISTSFSESKLSEDDSNSTDSKEVISLEKPSNRSGEFKPSPHLGGFLELDSVEAPPPPAKPAVGYAPAPPLKRPPTGFKSSKKFPFYDQPYKFESPILLRAKPWRPSELPSQPLDTSHPGDSSRSPDSGYPGDPARSPDTGYPGDTSPGFPGDMPAGGLYKYSDPFQEKPGDQLFDFHDEGKGVVKKRPSPWKQLLHMLTALIPVGIIVSALTPNVITVENSAQGSPFSGRFVRRADSPPPPPQPPALPVISERCRRRLLCELYSDRLYELTTTEAPELSTSCHHLRCADPRSVTSLISWLLQTHWIHQQPHNELA